ncbi:redox-sensitive transcriptional activator SoxR [Nonomuraea sp. NPDC049400]|uniref:redox-sensitive transcriptional activator SoxR n=1 Tax=Nonomuraea sp. NPDC049400 TaxID=3364352 RepID=UPI0037BBA241
MEPTPSAQGVEELLTIGEVGRRSGVAVSALRFYEDQGLLTSTRTAGNQRRYPRHVLRRVSLISAAKRFGLPLSDVKTALAALPADGAPTADDWKRASRVWKELLEERRRALDRLIHEINGCIGCGCLSMKACALLNPGDVLAETGPGPRRL